MAAMTGFVGERSAAKDGYAAEKAEIRESIERLAYWLETHDYRGYDTFDGLSSPLLRPLTFETKLGRTILLQGVRRFPINLRPLLRIPAEKSSKGMGFLARGFLRMHQATEEPAWLDKARFALQWLIDHQSAGYSGACWGNHFDYQSRGFYLKRGVPTVVWTSLIGHAFLDGYDHLKDERYLEIAVSACEHLLRDVKTIADGEGRCIAYVPGMDTQVHNASTLSASLLARTYSHTKNGQYQELAKHAIQYTSQHQRENGSWYYGEREDMHWVDNFHTAYVLDCFLRYEQSTGDQRFHQSMMRGYEYWKETFFCADGTPRYYDRKTLPIDIQCSSQAIDTLAYFSDLDPSALDLSVRVAKWTIDHMQDPSGYFYYRRYSPRIVNKTATLHWGQATMMCALSSLYKSLNGKADCVQD